MSARVAAGVGASASSPTWSRRFTADGATLEARLWGPFDEELAERLARVVGGYRTALDPAVGGLDLWTEGDGFTLRSDVDRGPAGFELPFATDLAITDPDYLLFALDEWVSSTSLQFGTPAAPRLHAASFELDGRCWIAAGPSHSGKSSLALDAVMAGGRYLTDERTTVSAGQVRGLPRPLRLRLAIDEARRRVGHGHPLDEDAARTILTIDPTSSDAAEWRVPDCLVVLAESPPERARVSWVSRALVELSMNAVALGPAGLLELVALADSCAVHLVGARTFSSVRHLGVPALAASANAPAVVPTYDGPVTPGHRIASGVTTIAIDDECVVWIPGPTARVMTLADDAAAAWRRALDGDGGLASPGSSDFVLALESAGALVADR